jgi:hypothetical protein
MFLGRSQLAPSNLLNVAKLCERRERILDLVDWMFGFCWGDWGIMDWSTVQHGFWF